MNIRFVLPFTFKKLLLLTFVCKTKRMFIELHRRMRAVGIANNCP
jgi:hypothetical protein